MEFILSTDLSVLPKSIEFNAEELKTELAPRLEYYNSLVVTEDSIKAAKSDKAALNKLKTAIEDKRKEVKKLCLAPYESFEKQCKEIISMIDAPIIAIDTQVKAFGDIRKQQKYEELQKFFEYIGHPDYVSLDDILNPKWSNSTLKIETLRDELYNRIEEINRNYAEIEKMYGNLPIFTAISDKFKSTLDKSQTLVYAATLERQYRQEQERKAREAQLVQKTAEAPAEAKTTEPIPQTLPEGEPDPVVTGTFRVSCTRSELIALRDFMKNHGIHFEIIK